MLTKTQQAEVTYWNNEFKRCKTLREPFEQQWYLNLAFYNGKQYAIWAPTSAAISSQRLVEPPAPRHRVRLVANKVRPIIRTEITKLTKEEPQFYVKPSTTESSDVSAARAAENIAEFVIDVGNYNKARRTATFWMSICGTAFIKSTIVDDSENKMPCNIVMDGVTAWHLFVPNLEEEDIQKQDYVIQARNVTSESVLQMYGVDLSTGGIKSATESVQPGPMVDQKFLNALGIKSSQIEQKLVFMMEIWVKPCKKYPNGGFLVFANDRLIYWEKPQQDPNVPQEDLSQIQTTQQMLEAALLKPEDGELPGWTNTVFPYEHAMFPYAKIDHIPSGSFYSTSVIPDLIPLQRVYNRIRSAVIEAGNRAVNPRTYYIRGAIDPNRITTEPGLFVPVNPGFDIPKSEDPPIISSFFQEELDRTLKDMDDSATQGQIDRGVTPPGVEAASAIAYLQEENDSKLYHTVASIEDATRIVGYQVLCLAHEFWDEEKIIAVVSKNGAQEAGMFKTADIKKNSDLRVETSSMAPRSRTAKQAFIVDLMKQGIIPPEKGLRYLEMNETNRLYEELQADSKQAQRENIRMATVVQPPAPTIDPMTMLPAPQAPVLVPMLPSNPWDNHQIHLYEHGLYMKSQEFELLPEENKKAIISHYLITQQAIVDEVNGRAISTPTPGDESGNPVSTNGDSAGTSNGVYAGAQSG